MAPLWRLSLPLARRARTTLLFSSQTEDLGAPFDPRARRGASLGPLTGAIEVSGRRVTPDGGALSAVTRRAAKSATTPAAETVTPSRLRPAI